ncbi:MAG: glycosyltransferase [Pyrobaculum sp.]
MNVAVVAPQSSHWEDEHRAAVVLVKALRRIGHNAWLVASVYHEGRPALDPDVVERSETGFVEARNDPSGVPTIRVLSTKSFFPPGAVSLRAFVKVLSAIDQVYPLDAVIVTSSFWNGPEEAAKWTSIRKALHSAGEVRKRAVFIYVPFYPMRISYFKPVESASRTMWAAVTLPTVLSEADAVVTCCQQELAHLGRRVVNAVECRDWVDPDLAQAAEEGAVKLPAQLESFEHVVSYVGPIAEEKNIRALVKLSDKLSSLKDVAVAVAGRGEAAEKFAREARGRRNLVYIPSPTLRELAALMSRSVAGVDFSHYEPAGIRALEYLYLGTPVAASPGSKAWLFVTDGVDGVRLSNPDDVDGAARWITQLVNRPEVRDEMGKKGRGKADVAVKLAELLAKRIEGLG